MCQSKVNCFWTCFQDFKIKPAYQKCKGSYYIYVKISSTWSTLFLTFLSIYLLTCESSLKESRRLKVGEDRPIFIFIYSYLFSRTCLPVYMILYIQFTRFDKRFLFLSKTLFYLTISSRFDYFFTKHVPLS